MRSRRSRRSLCRCLFCSGTEVPQVDVYQSLCYSFIYVLYRSTRFNKLLVIRLILIFSYYPPGRPTQGTLCPRRYLCVLVWTTLVFPSSSPFRSQLRYPSRLRPYRKDLTGFNPVSQTQKYRDETSR